MSWPGAVHWVATRCARCLRRFDFNVSTLICWVNPLPYATETQGFDFCMCKWDNKRPRKLWQEDGSILKVVKHMSEHWIPCFGSRILFLSRVQSRDNGQSNWLWEPFLQRNAVRATMHHHASSRLSKPPFAECTGLSPWNCAVFHVWSLKFVALNQVFPCCAVPSAKRLTVLRTLCSALENMFARPTRAT